MQVELNVSGMHKDLEGRIPITLGTIPLVSLQAAATPSPNNGVDISNVPTQPASPSSPPAYGTTQTLPGWNAALYPTIREYFYLK